MHTPTRRRQFQPRPLMTLSHGCRGIAEEQTEKMPVQRGKQFAPLVIPAPDAACSGASFRDSTTASVAGKRGPRLRTGALLSIAVVLGIVALYTWLDARETTAVTLYQVERQDATQYTGGGGIVFPRQQLDLSYPVAERVITVLVKAGDEVNTNQPLLKLDPTQLDAQVKQAADNMAATQAYLASVSASGNAIAVAQAQQQYNLARNRYNALVAQTSSPLLHNGELVSPMRGVVTSVAIDSGEVFAADTTLLTIMDESVAVVHAKIPLVDLEQVALNQQAIVTPSALPDHDLQGVVSAIVPHADPQTDTFELWVNVPNPGRTLLPGMSAFVRLQTRHRAVVVPRLAVLDLDHRPSVFIVQDQHAYLRRVQVAGRVNDATIIASGLSAGEKVVLVGIDTLCNGQKVRIRAIEASIRR